jgi:hypothetical protein
MPTSVKSFESLIKSHYGPKASGDEMIRQYVANIAQNAYGADLQKAMATGPGLTVGGIPVGSGGLPMGNVAPLALQNLDPVMTSVLFTEKQFKLFAKLPRVPSLNLVYEFNRKLQYGGGRRIPGFVEGGAPQGGTARYERDAATIRFAGVRRGITHQLMQAQQMGGMQIDPMAEENRNGTIELLQEIETLIFFGDEGILSNNSQKVSYDGIYKQLVGTPANPSIYKSSNVRDLQGQPVTPELLEDAARQLYETAYVTSFSQLECLASPQIITDFSKMRFNLDRREVVTGNAPETWTGIPFGGHNSNFGRIPLEPHLFFQRVIGDKPIQPTVANSFTADPGAPATPATVSLAAAANTLTAWAGIPAGTYYYTVASFNDSGESLPYFYTTGVTPTAGQQVTVTITQVSGATGYRIYRGTKSDGSDAQWIADVPDGGSGGTTYIDANQKIPGSSTLLMWINDEETLVIPQFMPLLRWPIAITTTTVEWFILLYHTFKLKAPQRMILFTNVGALT